MDDEKVLQTLIEILEKNEIKVKYDRGNFKGGLVKYKEENYFYLNRKADTTAKINVIVHELKDWQWDEGDLPVEIEEILRNAAGEPKIKN